MHIWKPCWQVSLRVWLYIRVSHRHQSLSIGALMWQAHAHAAPAPAAARTVLLILVIYVPYPASTHRCQMCGLKSKHDLKLVNDRVYSSDELVKNVILHYRHAQLRFVQSGLSRPVPIWLYSSYYLVQYSLLKILPTLTIFKRQVLKPPMIPEAASGYRLDGIVSSNGSTRNVCVFPSEIRVKGDCRKQSAPPHRRVFNWFVATSHFPDERQPVWWVTPLCLLYWVDWINYKRIRDRCADANLICFL